VFRRDGVGCLGWEAVCIRGQTGPWADAVTRTPSRAYRPRPPGEMADPRLVDDSREPQCVQAVRPGHGRGQMIDRTSGRESNGTAARMPLNRTENVDAEPAPKSPRQGCGFLPLGAQHPGVLMSPSRRRSGKHTRD